MAAKRGSQSAPGATPQSAQRRVTHQADTTKPAPHALSVSAAQSGPMTMRKRAETTAVTGPSQMPGTGSPVKVHGGKPVVSGTGPADVDPCCS